MRIKITAGGIYGQPTEENPTGELPIGTELTVQKAPEGWAGRYIDLDADDKPEDDRDENGDTPGEAQLRRQFDAAYKQQGEQLQAKQVEIDALNGKITDLKADIESRDAEIAALRAGQANSNATGTYAVLDKGRGWWAITLDGKEVTKSLREDDVKEFDKLSDADKAAFVDLHKPD